MSSALSRVLMRTLVTFVVAVALVVLGLGVTTQTAWGRGHIATLVSRYASERMQGKLEIGRIEEFGWSRIAARDVTIRGPDGRPAIQALYAEVEPNFVRWLRGELVSAKARVRDGMVALRESPDGKLNIEEAFRGKPDGKQKEGGGDQEKGSKVQVDFQNIATTNMRLSLSGGSLPSLQFASLNGIMRIHTAEDVDLWLQFDQYRGAMTQGLPTGVLRFRDVSGHVQTSGNRLLRFRGLGEPEGEELRFEIDYLKEPEKQIALKLEFSEPSAEAFAARLASLYGKMSDQLEVKVTRDR